MKIDNFFAELKRSNVCKLRSYLRMTGLLPATIILPRMPQEPLELDVEGELRLKSRGGETEAVAATPSPSKLEEIHEESEKQSLPEQGEGFHSCKTRS